MLGCENNDSFSNVAGKRGPGLIFCVSGDKQPTRQSNAVVLPSGNITECYLFPFNGEGEILSKSIQVTQRFEDTSRYYDEDVSIVPIGTSFFICYAKEQDPFKKEIYPNASEEDLKFANGSTLTTLTTLDQDSEQGISTVDISFSPEVIYKEKTNVGDEENPQYEITVDTKATAIANYLTAIASVLKGKDNDLFLQFINHGHLLPCSSRNVAKLVAWAKSTVDVNDLMSWAEENGVLAGLNSWAAANGVDLSEITNLSDIPIPDYPNSISLPDGAAVVLWNPTANKFEPQMVTTTEANINSLDRFVYPASLWYYVSSGLKTSYSFLEEFFDDDKSWSQILDSFEYDDSEMEDGINSVAIKDPMYFAMGCLQIGLAAPESLKDAAGTTITLKANENDGKGTFSLTGVFIAGQHEQDYRFTPKDDNQEYIIYDKTIPEGMSLGASATAAPDATLPTVSTLAFQTMDYRSVRIALEFSNNSGVDFEGVNGTVFDGTKFYVVGTINIHEGETVDYLKRAFTKDFITKGTVTISSLEKVYNYLPDLLEPRLEIGVKLVPDWIQSMTTNVLL